MPDDADPPKRALSVGETLDEWSDAMHDLASQRLAGTGRARALNRLEAARAAYNEAKQRSLHEKR